MFSGDQSQGAASPVPLKKDVENMEKGNVFFVFFNNTGGRYTFSLLSGAYSFINSQHSPS